LQSSIQKSKGQAWAKIEDATISCSPQKAQIDDTVAISVNFKLNGGIRRNFVRKLWEAAYDDHDLGLRIGYWVTLLKQRGKLLPSTEVKKDKFVRRAVFFWTRNPELPYRVWATVATEFETILYPKTEEEAQDMLFNVTRNFEIPAKTLGPGEHNLEAKARVKWGKHVFTESGEISGKTLSVKLHVQ
jgi:hypothetical protein